MQTILEVLKFATDCLQALESPRKEAEFLLADFLNMRRLDLYLDFDRPLENQEIEIFKKRLQRRALGEPAQYIHGQIHFYGISLLINSSVLIPRPETEILVDMAAKVLSQEELKGKSCLDLCTGSGCIGLALKKKFPELRMHLSDLSEEALKVAMKNGRELSLNVTYTQGDLFDPISSSFDFIICNPPYVSLEEYQTLHSEVKNFEPKMALLGGVSGYEFYQRLSQKFPLYLNSKGKVWLEIGKDQGSQILELFSKSPWKKRELKKDWAGHDRFIFLEIE